ncbi:MAG: DNA replication/repair protein RecF [Acidimicrobiia bacterium]|nr:DNA replication/repair protein RecF [Acidimicrobiia bacterium]
MYLTSLTLNDFRIIKKCDLEFSKGVTAFIGDNGQGKTSILESIFWAGHCKSFRHVSNDLIIKNDAVSSHIRINLSDDIRPQDIVATINRVGRDVILVNGQRLKKIKDLLGTLRVTIFTPDDLEIIKGSATLRREAIDDTLLQVSKKFVAANNDYLRILKQKNALLKSGNPDINVLSVLNDSLVMSGSQIIKGRLAGLSRMRKFLSNSYSHVGGDKNNVDVQYQSKIFLNEVFENLDVEEIMLLFSKSIEENSDNEFRRYHSVVGPHRDDYLFTISERDSRTQASQGEQRTMALALKMALHSLIVDMTGDNPILLLDDVFSELDTGRTHRLVECLPATQTFVTSANEIPSSLKVDQTFYVKDGMVNKNEK